MSYQWNNGACSLAILLCMTANL